MSAKKNEGEVEPEVKEAFDAWLEAQGGKERLVSRVRAEKVANLIKGATWETKIGELLESKGKDLRTFWNGRPCLQRVRSWLY